MIKKENILFLVGTEYHMLVTLSAVADRYSDPEKYQITIWQIGTTEKEWFLGTRQISYPHVSYRIIPVHGKHAALNDTVRRAVRLAERQQYDAYIFFNDVDLLSVYLARRLKSKGTKVILGPDGMKAYSNISRIAPRWCLNFAVRYYKFLRNNKLIDGRGMYWPSLKYAYLKEIDEVWVPFAVHYKNWNSKRVTEVKVMETPASISLITKFFGFNPSEELPIYEKVIFLVGMPPISPHFEQMNLHIVSQLREKFPEQSLLIKLHPSSGRQQVLDLEKVGAVLINRPFPAEIYIAQLKDSIVASYWSTSSLINNPSCRFYWLYPILRKETTKLDYMNLINPTSHIVEVDEIGQIK
ncbi:MAG TPA: polysialyltransferase family glycosyltransferase [Flavobacterium sp.]|jgi:hypothetical protein